MKRTILTIVLLAMAVCGYAQTGLKGTWEQSQSMMGTSASDVITFQDEKAGKVVEKMKMGISMSMFGIKVTGEGEGYLEGTFKYEGDKITIKWNEESFKFDMTKPIKVTMKNEDTLSKEDKAKLEKTKKDMAKDWEKEFDSFKEDMKKKLGEEDVFTNVKVSAKKLSYNYVEDGKTETDKYTRVQ